jgi:hypothetical protein
MSRKTDPMASAKSGFSATLAQAEIQEISVFPESSESSDWRHNTEKSVDLRFSQNKALRLQNGSSGDHNLWISSG